MAAIRILVLAGALAVPALAAAETPTELCDGNKMEEKQTTAEKSSGKADAEKSDKKADEKSEPKAGAKEDHRS